MYTNIYVYVYIYTHTRVCMYTYNIKITCKSSNYIFISTLNSTSILGNLEDKYVLFCTVTYIAVNEDSNITITLIGHQYASRTFCWHPWFTCEILISLNEIQLFFYAALFPSLKWHHNFYVSIVSVIILAHQSKSKLFLIGLFYLLQVRSDSSRIIFVSFFLKGVFVVCVLLHF